MADEPTTGLDAHQADKMVAKLKETAAETRAAVVAVLHQPRSRSFERLDDLTLLTSGGKVAYCGPVAHVLKYFERMGHACPTHHNPAEFLIDLVAVDADGAPEEEAADARRVQALVDAWEASKERGAVLGRASSPVRPVRVSASTSSSTRSDHARKPTLGGVRLGAAKQTALLVRRAWRQTRREAWVNAVRLAASAGLATAFGACNKDLGNARTPCAAAPRC